MVARSCYILEFEAHELLRGLGYNVRILQTTHNKHGTTLCIVAFRKTGETRYVRIKKVTRRPAIITDVEARCCREVALYRRLLACIQPDPGLHCEIWIFDMQTGFHCYEVLRDSIREIPTPALKDDNVLPVFPKNPVPTRGTA